MKANIVTKRLSFEYFPPKTPDGHKKLIEETAPQLWALSPEFMSVTYGAGGSTRDFTKQVVSQLKAKSMQIAPHLSFGGDNEERMIELLTEYKNVGVNRIVALRGDMPSGMGAVRLVYANELVAFIRRHFGNQFHLEVAAYPEIHPQSENYASDIHFLKEKFNAGADSGITQYFYNTDAYFYFMDDCRKAGIDKPIYPGIMPITNYANLSRFSAACGAELPRWMVRKLDSYKDDAASIRSFGIDIVSKLCETLLQGGAPGLHFYTMNQIEPMATIVRQFNLK